MNQFRIKGIDYDDSLEHGLGKGSGRGRPKGSKNGQVMPGAAYMKGYEIVGHKVLELPTARNNNSRLSRSINEKTATGRTTAVGSRKNAQSAQKSIPRIKGSNGQWRNQGAAAKVSSGKNVVSQLMGGGSSTQKNIPTIQGSNGQWRNTEGTGGSAVTAARDLKPAIEQRARDTTVQPTAQVRPTSQAMTQTPTTRVQRSTDTGTNDYGYTIQPADQNGRNGNAKSVRENPTLASASPLVTGGRPGDRSIETNPINVNPIDVNPINTRTIEETMIPEQTIREQTITEQSPANAQSQQQETPEQKSIWDSIGGWLSGAGKTIADTAVGAWNTATGVVSDAAKWVGDQMGPVGDWAQTAVNDVGQWVGARAQEFGNWLGGAANDAGRWLGNAANDVGQWVGNAAGDVGRTLGNAANGADDALFGRYNVVNVDRNGNPIYGNQRNGGLLNAAGQWIGNAANDVGQWVGNAANDAGQWIGNAANSAADTVLGRYNVVNVDRNGNPIYGNQRNGGWLGSARTAMNDAGQWIGNAANDVGQWVGNAAGDVGRWANQNIVRPADEWWNGRDIEINDNGHWRQGHEAGARENIGNAVNAAGQWVGNAAGDVGQWVNDAANSAADTVLGRYNVVNVDQNGNPIYGNQRNGGWLGTARNAANDAWQGVVNAAGDVGEWANQNIVRPTDRWWNGYDHAGGTLIDAKTGRVLAIDEPGHAPGFREQLGQTILDLPDTVLGRYNVVNVDRNGNPIYGNQRNGGWLGAARTAANDAGQWIGNAANDVGQWVGNAAGDVGGWANQNIVQPTDRWWNGYDEPGMMGMGPVHNPGARENIGNALTSAWNGVSNTAQNALNGVVDAANSVGQAISNTVDNAVQSYNNNQAVGGYMAAARRAGVPETELRPLMEDYQNGQISVEELGDVTNRLIWAQPQPEENN